MRKITVIGHFAFDCNCVDGQTVKSKSIVSELEKNYNESQIIKIDTDKTVKNLFKSIGKLFLSLFKSDNIIMMPAHNGVKLFGILLPICKGFFKKIKLHYIVIGGWLPSMLNSHYFIKRQLKKFDFIYVETEGMNKELNEIGLTNVVVMPNFKDLKISDKMNFTGRNSVPYKLCTYSRVIKEKGIEDIVNSVIDINKFKDGLLYTLDIYGPVDESSFEWFNNLKLKFPEFINYCGVVEPEDSVKILEKYFALIFPTRFYTEGIPGTIIDAYAAGLPVIASRWENYRYIIDENKTGLTYPFEKQNALTGILINIAQNPKIIENMRENVLNKAMYYLPENVIKILLTNLE